MIKTKLGVVFIMAHDSEIMLTCELPNNTILLGHQLEALDLFALGKSMHDFFDNTVRYVFVE